MDAIRHTGRKAEPGRAVVPAVFHRHVAEPLDLDTLAAAVGDGFEGGGAGFRWLTVAPAGGWERT